LQNSIVFYYDNNQYEKPVVVPPPFTPAIPTATPFTPAIPTATPFTPATPTFTLPSSVKIVLFTNDSIFDLGEIVNLSVKATGFSGAKKVALDVTDPRGNSVVSRTIDLSSGVDSSIKFKISENFKAGTYTTTANILDKGQTITETSYFKIKSQFNSFTISDVSATDQQGNPSTLESGEMGFIKVNLKSSKLISTLVTVNLFDSELTSMGIGSVKTNLSSGDSEIILSFMIPDDAALGPADIYVNSFSDWPSNGGIALTSEFAITQYVGTNSSSSNFNFIPQPAPTPAAPTPAAPTPAAPTPAAPTPAAPTPATPTVENNSSVNFGQTSNKTEGTFNSFYDYGISITSNIEQGSRIILVEGTTSSNKSDLMFTVITPSGNILMGKNLGMPNPDGTFSTEFDVTNWKQDGQHMIMVLQGSDFAFRDSIQVNVINGATDTR
jgi:hypothetical protein